MNDAFAVNVPFARAVNPVTKTNWERVGVAPHVDVPAGRALLTAHKDALERIIAAASDDEAAQDARAALRRITAELEKPAESRSISRRVDG